MKRALKITEAVLIALTRAVVVVLHLWLGRLIKRGLEDLGPLVTGTSVRLDDVDIGLLAGRVQIEGLVLGSPKGFHAPSSLKIAKARLRINWRSLLSSCVKIEEIRIESPQRALAVILLASVRDLGDEAGKDASWRWR